MEAAQAALNRGTHSPPPVTDGDDRL